jgi:hypothetical protein
MSNTPCLRDFSPSHFETLTCPSLFGLDYINWVILLTTSSRLTIDLVDDQPIISIRLYSKQCVNIVITFEACLFVFVSLTIYPPTADLLSSLQDHYCGNHVDGRLNELVDRIIWLL